MVLQYLRKIRVTFPGGFVVNPGGITPHELFVSFDTSQSISSSQNSANIDLYNLTQGHRNAIGKEFDEIILEAGYMPPSGGDNVGIIFKGNIRDVSHKRSGPDIITTVSCGDGDKALRNATISKSYPKGTKVKDVVNDLYKELEKEGVKRGEWKFPDENAEFKRPYAACGSCTRELNTIGRGQKFYWSVQNGVMEIIPGDGYVGQIALISPETGMIDTPTITDNGMRVSALLNPDIRPGHRVKVQSSVVEMNAQDGIYRVTECGFRGDNRGGEFRVDVSGEAVIGNKVDEGKKK